MEDFQHGNIATPLLVGNTMYDLSRRIMFVEFGKLFFREANSWNSNPDIRPCFVYLRCGRLTSRTAVLIGLTNSTIKVIWRPVVDCFQCRC